MFEVKGGALEAFVHPAVLASPSGTRPNCTEQFFWHGR